MKTSERFLYIFFLTCLTYLLFQSCSKDDPPAIEESEITPIDLNFEESPIDLRGNNALFARDVSYGPYEDNVFEIFLENLKNPHP